MKTILVTFGNRRCDGGDIVTWAVMSRAWRRWPHSAGERVDDYDHSHLETVIHCGVFGIIFWRRNIEAVAVGKR